jgi:hypothetical protein
MGSVGLQPFQLEALRARLQIINDQRFIRIGKGRSKPVPAGRAARHRPRQVFLDQLREARAGMGR